MSSTTSTDDRVAGASGPQDGGGGSSGNGNGGSKKWVTVCNASEVSEDGQMLRAADGGNILIARYGGRVHATDAVCTHADADLSCGFMGPDGVRCPLHLSVFDLETGVPQNPPAEKPLRVYNVRIHDGHIQVEM